ncbi:hypothetical protein GCM10010359_62120 [Streptomyces morookaense]|nr:hypothetical protein GCM10010359_62120 [Streptomyces morookaense]
MAVDRHEADGAERGGQGLQPAGEGGERIVHRVTLRVGFAWAVCRLRAGGGWSRSSSPSYRWGSPQRCPQRP